MKRRDKSVPDPELQRLARIVATECARRGGIYRDNCEWIGVTFKNYMEEERLFPWLISDDDLAEFFASYLNVLYSPVESDDDDEDDDELDAGQGEEATSGLCEMCGAVLMAQGIPCQACGHLET